MSEQSTAWTGSYQHRALQEPYLEDPLGVSSHGRVQRGPSHVVPGIGIGPGVQEPLGSVGAGVASCQVQGHLPSAVCLSLQVGPLVDQVCDDVC